jgi:DNA-binding beta-propeller fold protein YncE
MLLALVLVLTLGARMLVFASPALAVESGTLSQLAAPFECIGEEREASAICGTLVPYGANAAYELQVSPDGKSAYSVAVGKPSNQGALDEYSRNPATGALTVIGCLTSEPSPACASQGSETGIAALEDPAAVIVSPDGANVYVIGQGEGTLVEFTRSPETGLLAKIGCITAQATSAECATTSALGLNTPYGATISPDGKSVYVTSLTEEAIAEFEREPATGALTAIAGNGCIGSAGSGCPVHTAIGLKAAVGVVASPDDKDIYVAAGAKEPQGDIAAFERNETTGALKQLAGEKGCIGHNVAGCAEDTPIESTEALAISPDGKNIYANAYAENAVVELQREADGSLTALGGGNACVTTGTITGCKTVSTLLGSPLGVAISPGAGEDVYVTSSGQSAVVELTRNPGTGVLELLPEGEGCVTGEDNGCGASGLLGLTGARRLTVSPDGTNVYVAAQGGNAFAELARTVTPTVSSIDPTQGSEAGGTTVTIEGSGFREGAKVEFGAEEASDVEVKSATELTALAPAHEQEAVTVKVVNPAGEGVGPTYEYVPGGLSIANYCESLGDHGTGETGPTLLSQGGVEGPEYAYRNWACIEGSGNAVALTVKGAPPSFADACHSAYGSALPFAYPGEVNNAYSWGCHASADPSLEAEPEIKATTSSNNSSTAKTGTGGGGSGAPLRATPTVPAPVLAETGNVAPVSGTVTVRLPGSKTFVALSSLRQIPFGTVIEATDGRVSITTATTKGGVQAGEFFGGEFILRQARNGIVVAELTGGNFSVCPTARERSHLARVGAGASSAYARAATSGSHVVRKLWANAHGKFSTKGNYAAGAVQGTEWLTEDLCDGTLIRVTRDKVKVTNLVNHRHAEVKTGHKYLAKAP